MRCLRVVDLTHHRYRHLLSMAYAAPSYRAMSSAKAETISLLTLGLRAQDSSDSFDKPQPPCRVLVCGDGDFSYSAALVRHLDATHRHATVVATCFLDGFELARTHPLAADHASAILAYRAKHVLSDPASDKIGSPTHVVLEGVDATQLAKSLPAALEKAANGTAEAITSSGTPIDDSSSSGTTPSSATSASQNIVDEVELAKLHLTGNESENSNAATTKSLAALSQNSKGTKLPDAFDRIVWNFPQHPERKKIQFQRQLLHGFFQSAAPLLAPGGSVWLTLKGGQGGSGAEEEGFAGRPTGTTWQCQEQAAAGGGLVLAAAVPAAGDLSILCEKGYRSVGFRGSDKSFLTGGALTHVFCKPEVLPVLADITMTTPQPMSRSAASANTAAPSTDAAVVDGSSPAAARAKEVDCGDDSPSEGNSEEPAMYKGETTLPAGGISPLKGCAGRVAFPETHRHDLSMWIKPESFHEADLCTFLTQLFVPHGIEFELAEFDRYFDESTGKHSRAFHVDLVSHTAALSKAHASQLMRVAATHLGARRPVGFDDHLQSASDIHTRSSSSSSSSSDSPLSLPPRLAAAVEGRYRYDLLPTSRGGTAPDEALKH